MKLKLSLLFMALFASTTFCATQPLTIAVFDFEAPEASLKDLGQKVAMLITANLSGELGLITLERAELDKALGEQELGLSGTVSSDTAARVGHLTGAKVLVTGRIFKADKEMLAVAKIIGTETGRVYGQTAKIDPSSELSAFSESLAQKIAAILAAKGETLVAHAQSPEKRIQDLLASVKLANPLAVSVVIPEQHFGSPVVDPAAQTQLLSLFQKAGFEIVDSKSDKKPDIEITGEAFSAFALRKGNLIACKARVELVARQRHTGKILYTGSRTSVATDITEQTAGKTALENAALDIAGPLLAAAVK